MLTWCGQGGTPKLKGAKKSEKNVMRHSKDHRTKSTEMVLEKLRNDDLVRLDCQLNSSRFAKIKEYCMRQTKRLQNKDHQDNEDNNHWRWTT